MDIEKAKERLKNKLENDKGYLEKCNPFSDIVNEVIADNNAIEIVLNELEKKDKKIARLGKTANEYKKAIQCEKCNCSVCEAHINTLELRAELEKKDKVINEMANKIHKLALYYDDEGTYCEMRHETCDELDNVEDIHKHCNKCIKEYFTKRVEKGENI